MGAPPPLATRYAPAGPPMPAGAPYSIPYVGYATPMIAPYVPARPLANVVVPLVGAMIAFELAAVWLAIEQLGLSRQRLAGIKVSDEPTLATMIVGLIAMVPMILYIVYWMMWVFRTYRNLPALGAGPLRFSPGWAVGYYFIPILHLFRPYQVMRETWLASDPQPNAGQQGTTLINGWWALNIVAFTYAVVGTVMVVDDSPRMTHVFALAEFGRIPVGIAKLVLEIALVRQLTRRQEHRASMIAAAQVPAISSALVV